MTDEGVACHFYGKSVEPAPEVDVREGEKRFHLACYRLYKHPPPPKSN